MQEDSKNKENASKEEIKNSEINSIKSNNSTKENIKNDKLSISIMKTEENEMKLINNKTKRNNIFSTTQTKEIKSNNLLKKIIKINEYIFNITF